jgi:hypothetical protein
MLAHAPRRICGCAVGIIPAPNVELILNDECVGLQVYTLRDIAPGEQLCADYGEGAPRVHRSSRVCSCTTCVACR